MPAYPLAVDTWGPEEYEAIQAVIASRQFTMGAKVREFEDAAAQIFGSKHALMVNSGSSANLLGIAALRFVEDRPLRPGDEVIVPAISWSTTYAPLWQHGLSIRLVDVESASLNLDIGRLEEAISPKTKAVFAVNLLGAPADYDALIHLCERHGLQLLEDNCESMGATYNGRSTGTFGRFGTLSTFFSHHISTMEGGVLLTDDDDLYEVALSIRAHGWVRDLPAHSRWYTKLGDAFHDSFIFVLPGYNLRPLELEAAIGLKQLERLASFVDIRRANASRFMDRFGNDEHVAIQRPRGRSSWFGFALILRGALAGRRDLVVEALRHAEIETRPIVAGNFRDQPVARLMEVEAGPLPVAEWVHRDGLFVGNHHYELKEEIDLLRDVIDEACRSTRDGS